MKNSPYPDLQYRTSVTRTGDIRLVVDAVGIAAEGRCTDGWPSPIGLSKWPLGGVVVDVPEAPQRQKTLTLTADWFTWRENCFLGDERSGLGFPPPAAEEDDGWLRCVSGTSAAVHVRMQLTRTRAHMRMRVRGGNGGGRCLRK